VSRHLLHSLNAEARKSFEDCLDEYFQVFGSITGSSYKSAARLLYTRTQHAIDKALKSEYLTADQKLELIQIKLREFVGNRIILEQADCFVVATT